MNYEEFKSAIVKMADQAVSAPKKVLIHPVIKNNGVKLDGLVIMEGNTNVAPSIYLNSFYEQYQKGVPLDQIFSKILEVYHAFRADEAIDTEIFDSYESVRAMVVYRLINYDRNRELLSEVPYIRFLDLAIVFYLLFCPENEAHGGTILIRNEHIEEWGITGEDLFADAARNSCRQLPAQLTSLQNMMERVRAELKRESQLETFDDGETDGTDSPDEGFSEAEDAWKEFLGGNSPLPMFVLTNEMNSYGAACVLYKDLLREYAEMMSCDFYVLPSSIHEVILVPAMENTRLPELSDMVRRVNESTLMPEEILADHAYYYSRKDNRIIA